MLKNIRIVCSGEYKEGKTMKTCAYLRVSTETQAERGYGLEMQELEILKYANERGIRIDKWYKDEGISGTTPLRRGMDGTYYSERQGLVDLMTDGCTTVIVYDSTRISRDTNVWGMIIYEMKDAGMELISVKEPDLDINTKDPTRIMMNAFRAGLADSERVKVNSRLADGRKNRATNGYKSCGVAPYGYEYRYDGKTGKSMGVFPNNEEAKRVQAIYYMYRVKKMNIYEITKEINRRKWVTRRGSKWSSASVARILNNPFYEGKIQWEGKLLDGQHEPIISPNKIPHYVKDYEN